ncbi:MAG: crossover junction endodeoxyribonuclease RuvC [Pseudomonadales bacterium]|jgi:crossover junction endodeoxyribonuclease RuvC|nr:crossover junction endodeoxyribonuclease RuvC [Pseudomonadales bacterium]
MSLVLGIDPGSRKCGYGFVNAVGSKLEYVASGVIRVEHLEFPQRLQTIYATLSGLIEQYAPEEAAIEEVFVGKSSSSALKLGQARGAAMVACTSHRLAVFEYATRKVKLAVVGTGAAAKPQIQHMIKNLLKLTDSPAEDAADALSVAVCHAHTRHSLIRLAGVRASRRGRLVR